MDIEAVFNLCPKEVRALEQQLTADLDAVADADALEQWRIKYLGSKGELKALMQAIKDVPKEQKRDFGQAANALQNKARELFEAKRGELGGGAERQAAKGPMLDLTEPGDPPRLGRRHVISQTISELIEVFGRMGFDVAEGPEVEDEFHNFVALNIPDEHPARDPLENYYLAGGDEGGARPQTAAAGGDPGDVSGGGGGGGVRLLRSQTSTVQIRTMERQRPPVRVISCGRVYRPDEHDATHYSMFHQIEGLYVDERVTMVDLKTTLYQFAHAFFGEDADVMLIPSYFPFTEPSAEFYVKMDVGKGLEWVELGGCGMVDPAVFEAVGYDPEQYTGFAFGLGIERIAMRKYGIPDIRWLFENDVRFLRQF